MATIKEEVDPEAVLREAAGRAAHRREAGDGALEHRERGEAVLDEVVDELHTCCFGVPVARRLAGALVIVVTTQRLTQRCRIIETKGESYCLRDAKTRARSRGTADAMASSTDSQAY